MWTGCQWKAVKREWFGVSSSVLHERFQTWQEEGRWERIMRRVARYYARERRTAWQWQSIDRKSVPTRRWVVECTLGGLAKRCGIRTRWRKKPENWLAFL
jgi:transposase